MNNKPLFNRREFKIFIFSFVGALLAIFCLELGLNLWLRSSLRKNLSQDLKSDTKIETAISWLSLSDFAHGRVLWVKINGKNCRIGDLRYAGLQVDNRGFTLDLAKLFRDKTLAITSLGQTKVSASISEMALQDYLNLFYPQVGLNLQILPEKLRLTAKPQILGNVVSARLDGKLEIASLKSLRFYPERLDVAGRAVPRDFLKFIGNQIPLEFSLMERWPLRITKVQLGQGKAYISFREVETK